MFSPQEAARYIETLKRYEFKAADKIKERIKDDFLSQAVNFLTKIRSINSTDAIALLTQFGSISGIAKASSDELMAVPGLGEKKVSTRQRLAASPLNRLPAVAHAAAFSRLVPIKQRALAHWPVQ